MHETTQVSYGDGTIMVIMSSESESEVAAPTIRFGDYNVAAQSCFTEKELSQIYSGEQAEVNIDFLMSDDAKSQEEHEQFFSNIPATSKGQEPYHEGVYIRIDANKEVGDEEAVSFDTFSEDVEMQLDIPLYMISENRSYYCMTNVMGVCDLLEDVDEDADTFTIRTHSLGSMLLLYRDNVADNVSDKQIFRISSKHLFFACIIILVIIWCVIDRLHRKDRL